MIRSLLSRRIRRSKRHTKRQEANIVEQSSPLIPDLLPLVIPYADQLTLCSLALVDRHTHQLVTPLLNDIIFLHSPSIIVKYFHRTKTRKVKHIDLSLDISFWLDPEFRKCTLDPDNIRRSKSWLSDLESLHLTTSGDCGERRIIVEEDRLIGSKAVEYDLQTIVEIWVKLLTSTRGPKHFRWRHMSNDIERPYGGTRWPFSFLSDYTSIKSVDLPMTEEPIMEGFKLSNLELQVLEYISFAGITITKPLLAGLLWEVNKGRRSKKKHKLRLDLVIRGEVRFDIDEGLVQLEKKQDEGLLRIIRSPAGVKTADEWREMLDKRQWHRK